MIKQKIKALALMSFFAAGSLFADVTMSNFGVGFTSFGGGALSATTKVGENCNIQAYFAMPTHSPLNLTVGAIYRHLHQPKTPGFHYGAGVEIGSAAGAFSLSVKPLIGIHLNLPGNENVQFSVDGGANIGITPAVAIAIGSMGQMPFASGSVHYYF